jgi:hypothetical protein
MADCQIFGLNPAGHDAVSAALHAINAVLLFLLLEKQPVFAREVFAWRHCSRCIR